MVAYEETARARARAKLANRAVQREEARTVEVSQIQARHAAEERIVAASHAAVAGVPPGATPGPAPALLPPGGPGLEPPPLSVLNVELGRDVPVPVRHPVVAAVLPAQGPPVCHARQPPMEPSLFNPRRARRRRAS